MPTELFTSKATYPNNIVIPPVALRHPAYYIDTLSLICLETEVCRVTSYKETWLN